MQDSHTSQQSGICSVCKKDKKSTLSWKTGTPVCKECRRRHEYCSQCGKIKKVAKRLENGAALCSGCHTRPQRECSVCNQLKRVAIIKDSAPICHGCYEPPKVACSVCSHVRPVASHKTGAPVCAGCYAKTYTRPIKTCTSCGEKKPVASQKTGEPTCLRCYQRSRRVPRPRKPSRQPRRQAITASMTVKTYSQDVRSGIHQRQKQTTMSDGVVRRIISSNKDFDQLRLIDWSSFRRLSFSQSQFEGTGQRLLLLLKTPATREGYETLMARLFPEAFAVRLLTIVRNNDEMNEPWPIEWLEEKSCSEDPGIVELLSPGYDHDSVEMARDGWRALGGIDEDPPTPDNLYEKKELYLLIRKYGADLPPRSSDLLLRYYGIVGAESANDDDLNLRTLGIAHGISRERVRQLLRDAISKMRCSFGQEHP